MVIPVFRETPLPQNRHNARCIPSGREREFSELNFLFLVPGKCPAASLLSNTRCGIRVGRFSDAERDCDPPVVRALPYRSMTLKIQGICVGEEIEAIGTLTSSDSTTLGQLAGRLCMPEAVACALGLRLRGRDWEELLGKIAAAR